MAKIIQMHKECDVDVEKALYVSQTIFSIFDGMDADSVKSELNGVCIALVMLARRTNRLYNVSEKDGIEKLILSWLAVSDTKSGLNFSEYIKEL